jgi:GxxExxY protein
LQLALETHSPCDVRPSFSATALNQLTSTVLAAAIRIHRKIGPGLLENAYFACLCHELQSGRIQFETQKPLPLMYDGVRIECAYRADIVVERAVIVEVKALDAIAPVHMRQLRTYTRLADCYVGLMLNFGAPIMKEGIHRVVNGFPEDKQRAEGAEAAETGSRRDR